MKTAAALRAALSEILPTALYRLPPEDAPRGIEDGVRVSSPVRDSSQDGLNAVSFVQDPDEELGNVRELEDMFEFGPDAIKGTPALGATEAEQIRQAVLVKGVEALGWYVPFHAVGAQWGIYIPTSGLAFVSENVFAKVSGDPMTRVKVAFRAIHQHELFHFATEYAVTQLELLFVEPFHVNRAKLRDPQLGYVVAEEKAANAWMLQSFRSHGRALRLRGRTQALRRFIAGQPPGYRDAEKIYGSDVFRAACRALATDFLENESPGAERINLDWLFPIRPRIDWRQCPVHVIHDSKRLTIAPGVFDLFATVRNIVPTNRFLKQLNKLPETLQRAWEHTEQKLSESTAIRGLDFKRWKTGPSDQTYSVRVSGAYRAHLRYDGQGRWFAEDIGSHQAMGHG